MAESDDECLHEIDVVMGLPDQSTELYLFQYPLRPSNRPYGDGGNNLIKVMKSEAKVGDSAAKHGAHPDA